MYPTRYELCFSCHAVSGPVGMEGSGRRIADFYNSAINPDETAGHQIRMDPDIALSWPSHVRVGDKLPCYDCHNPHGSQFEKLMHQGGAGMASCAYCHVKGGKVVGALKELEDADAKAKQDAANSDNKQTP